MRSILHAVQEKLSGKANCYCAFCRSPKRVYLKRRAGVKNILLAGGISIGLMYFIWQDFNPMIFLFFLLSLMVSEAFLQFRWRISVTCRECGFDPVLYVKKPEIAAEKVRAHLERRKNDPASLLKTPLNLPKINPKKSEDSPKGKILSRQI